MRTKYLAAIVAAAVLAPGVSFAQTPVEDARAARTAARSVELSAEPWALRCSFRAR